MDIWVGPAIIAAVVSGLVSVFGWFATFYIGLRRDQMLRDEKVHDFQMALRAEIVSDLLTMVVADRKAFLEDITAKYAQEPGYSVVVPHMARNVVFGSLLGEIQMLPSEVVAPVIHYERMRETIERFVADLRDKSFCKLPVERQVLMYSDYLEMLGRLERLAKDALAALEISLSIPDEDRLSPDLASATDAASALRQGPP